MILNKASTRLKMALTSTWQQESNYDGGNYIAPKYELPTYNDVPIMQLTNDETYNDALIKTYFKENISGYSQQSMNKYLYNKNEFKSSVNDYVDSMYKNKYNKKPKLLGSYGYQNQITIND
jgi:hypothetical protein